MSKKRNNQRRRLPHLPVMRELHNQFGLQMHTALARLKVEPDMQAYDALAQIFNLIGLTTSKNKKFQHEHRLIVSGASTMNQIERKISAKLPLKQHEITPLQITVNTIDEILGKLSVMDLYASMQQLRLIVSIESKGVKQ